MARNVHAIKFTLHMHLSMHVLLCQTFCPTDGCVYLLVIYISIYPRPLNCTQMTEM